MRVDVYHHYHTLEVNEQLDELLRLMRAIAKQEAHMSAELDALTLQVTANEDLEQSAITLIQGIAAQLAAAKDDPVKIQALSDSLKASADNLATAITANTPAA